MQDTEAKVVLSATDNASPVVKSLVDSLTSLQGAVTKNTEALGNIDSASRNAGSGMNLFNSSMIASVAAGLGLATTVRGAIDALMGFGAESVAVAGQMQLIQTKAEVL